MISKELAALAFFSLCLIGFAFMIWYWIASTPEIDPRR